MATVFESSFLSNRAHRMERYEESINTFGKCDCTSYSYLVLSVILFVIGTAITIFSLDDIVGEHIFFKLGHMWLIGPIFICSGLMVAVKCMLYLRRKSVIQIIFHQPQLFRVSNRLLPSLRYSNNFFSINFMNPCFSFCIKCTCISYIINCVI